VVEHSEYLPVLQALEGRTPTVALFAPALAGQFEASLGQVASALKALGFTEVMEVAEGADRTAQEEARELQERLEAGEPFMTTSCCPAYTALARKHLPLLAPRVSTTPTPLHFAAEEAARRYPGAKRIFIGPCLAKRSRGPSTLRRWPTAPRASFWPI
jgi:iron only hydrogenase large subunit-like protein